MFTKWFAAVIAGLSLLVMLAGCTQGLDYLFSSFDVGPEGGTFTASGGNVALTFPTGCMAMKTLVAVEPAADMPTGLVAGSAYNISAMQTTMMAKSAILTINYLPESVNGLQPSSLKLCEKKQIGNNFQWVALADSTLDTTHHTVSASISEFGTYAVIGASL